MRFQLHDMLYRSSLKDFQFSTFIILTLNPFKGAFMFQYIEEPETEVISSMVSKRKEAVMKLWNITEK